MKKLFIVFFIFLLVKVSAQQIVVNADTVSINKVPSPYPMIRQSGNSLAPAKPDRTKMTIAWFEPGDGSYSTDPDLKHTITSKQNAAPFMLATNLYDTGKGGIDALPSRMQVNTMSSNTKTGDRVFTEMFFNTRYGIKLNVNTRSIVPGDPMAFSITYKASSYNGAADDYRVYFYYNNNRTFLPITAQRKDTVLNGITAFPFVRVHAYENISYEPKGNFSNQLQVNSYEDRLLFKMAGNPGERTIFVSMRPYGDLEYGKSGSVYAVLTNSKDSVLARDTIGDMLFAPAHDPNYLVQSPYCLKLPKKAYPFNYHLHFQNTGEGPAREVKVVMQLPEGLDWSTFKFKSAFYAGENYDTALLAHRIDSKKNIATFIFKSKDAGHYLQGRSAPDPGNNPATMGDLYFTITATPLVKDKIEAYADILFKSVTPLPGTGEYEEPVRTNTAVTTYKDCCTCPPPVPPVPHCFTILGLCWWWWLLIPLILLFIIFLLVRRRSKR